MANQHRGDASQMISDRPENALLMKPIEARALFRKNGYTGFTSGFCAGYAQFNVIILSSAFADDFEKFCLSNSGALPLLYRSKVGEIGAPPLAEDSNIRADLPYYVIYKNGVSNEEVPDLNNFMAGWSDLVTFYIGCSSTFDTALVEKGVDFPNILDVPYFKSNIPCYPAGPFKDIDMYVSMRPIAKHQIAKAFMITSQYPDYHGAPAHIGDPARIGIIDCTTPDGYIPVFWACGFTVQDAISKAKPELTFSHYPGSMFMSDVEVKPVALDDTVEIIQISRPGCDFYASVINTKSLITFEALEKVLQSEEPASGISPHSDLLEATLTLSHAKNVLITYRSEPHSGICQDALGVLVLSKALLTLGKTVTLVVNEQSKMLFGVCIDYMVEIRALTPVVLPTIVVDSDRSDTSTLDCNVAINKCHRHQHLTLHAQSTSTTATIAVSGSLTATSRNEPQDKAGTPDFVVAAKSYVAGGFALSCGLYVVSTSPYHWRYKNFAINVEKQPPFCVQDFLPLSEQINSISEVMATMVAATTVNETTSSVHVHSTVHSTLEKFLDILGDSLVHNHA